MIKPPGEPPVPRTCVKCDQDDPYGDAIKCCRCHSRCRHLECFDPPLLNASVSDIRWKRWQCEDCVKAPFSARKLGQANQPRALQGLGLNPDTPFAMSHSARRSAQMASSLWAAMNETPRPRARVIDDEEDYEDEEEIGRRKRAKGVRAGTYDAEGRKLHYLKGKVIDVDELFRLVDEAGGYEAVLANKQWQTIRKKLDLPHTTSSSTQIRDAYLDYLKHAKKQ